MVVIVLTACPASLRGELTKWLQEITPGVFVGNVSRRVREELWSLVCEKAKTGRATMVFRAQNEQHYDFLVHNAQWVPVDFEGLRLITRLHSAADTEGDESEVRFSNASKHLMGCLNSRRQKPVSPRTYAVIDLETTGLSPESNEVIEIAAIKVVDGEAVDRYSCLVNSGVAVPGEIAGLTGITTEQLFNEGVSLADAIGGFLAFVGNMPLVAHNADFDAGFLRVSCDRLGFGPFENDLIDTLEMARSLMRGRTDFRLHSLVKSFGLKPGLAHRAESDCEATLFLYKQLAEEWANVVSTGRRQG